MPEIFVASPLAYTPYGREFLRQTVKPVLATNGLKMITVWDETWTGASKVAGHVTPEHAADAAAMTLGARTVSGLRNCRGVLAVLDGADVDSGVAAVVGYAAAIRKPTVGYRGDLRRSGDPLASTVNTQLEYFIRMTRGLVFGSLGDAVSALVVLTQEEI